MSAFNVLPRAQCLLPFIILINNVYSNMDIFTCCHPVSRFRTHSAPVPGLNFSGLQYAPMGPAWVPPVHSAEGRVRQMGCMVPRAAPAEAPLHYGVTELLEVPDFPLLCRHYFLLFILIINWTSFYYYFKIFFGVLIQEKKPQMTYLLTVWYVYKFKSHHNLIISTWNYFMSFTKWNTSYSVMFRHS